MRQNKPNYINSGLGSTNITSQHIPSGKQRHIGGIPPIKEPQLPPGRAASLMACTVTKRAYWIVFKQTSAGWVWERNMLAMPRPCTKAESMQNVVISQDRDLPELQMGGKSWGDWCCPGCSQKQRRSGKNYIHLATCRCGIDCCRGDDKNRIQHPACPNCGNTLHATGRTTQNLSGVARGELNMGDSRTLPATNRAELEGNDKTTKGQEIERRER